MSAPGGVPFRDVHPTGTGRRGLGKLAGQDLPPEAMLGPGRPNESRWIRCYQCGFPIDTTRHNLEKDRDGASNESVVMTGFADSVTQVINLYGCPFCGASESAHGPGR